MQVLQWTQKDRGILSLEDFLKNLVPENKDKKTDWYKFVKSFQDGKKDIEKFDTTALSAVSSIQICLLQALSCLLS